MDPHGELVEHILDWLGKNERIAERRKIHLLDLKDRSWSFGFNPLGTDDVERIEATVDQAVSAMASVMGGEDLTQTPLLRLSLNAVCVALAYAGLTLNEAPYLLKPNYPEERLAITSTILNPTYAQVWQGLNQMAEKQPKLYVEQFQAAERVRRQGFWDRWPPELKEGSAHLVGLIMQRICGEASVAFRWSSV